MTRRPHSLSLRYILQDESTLTPTLKYPPKRTRKRCIVEGCERSARKKGLCFTHGEKQLCGWAGCMKHDHQGGFCISHGGGKRCPVSGCTKSVQSGGRCYAHGGGQRCRYINCNKAVKRDQLCTNTPYDPLSVMHYRLEHSICFPKGDANTYCDVGETGN